MSVLTPVTNRHIVIDSGSTSSGRLHLEAADRDPGEEGLGELARRLAGS